MSNTANDRQTCTTRIIRRQLVNQTALRAAQAARSRQIPVYVVSHAGALIRAS